MKIDITLIKEEATGLYHKNPPNRKKIYNKQMNNIKNEE